MLKTFYIFSFKLKSNYLKISNKSKIYVLKIDNFQDISFFSK